jgi:Lar family restriction alleviation protein
MSEKLKPCPFCGGEAKLTAFVGETVMSEPYEYAEVCCANCKAKTHRVIDGYGKVNIAQKTVISLWNRRVENDRT